MTKEEIKRTAEEMIEAQCYESGLVREEVLEPSTLSFVEKYIHDEISREDLIQLSDYLEYPLNMEEVDKLKERRKKRLESRHHQKKKIKNPSKNKTNYK